MSNTVSPEERFDRLIDWDTSLTPRDEFLESVYGDDQLRIKFGADITAPSLHIGHGVNLRVMRSMQDMGHKVVFMLGGFTTLVGDPTDKLQARAAPEVAQLEDNKQRFVEQVGSVLNFNDPALIEVRDNTEWWGGLENEGTIKPIDLFKMLGTVTLNQLMSRDMFRQRQKAGSPIQMSEFLYPILQGYDSVMVESDVTVVGSDQLFNESMGRHFQERAGQRKQMIVCTKITPGLDGGPKQSKSIGNYVGISHTPVEKYDRLMRLKDNLTRNWFEVYSDIPVEDIDSAEETYADDPIQRKKLLAHAVTTMFDGPEAADHAARQFELKMQRRLPEEIPTLDVSAGTEIREVLRDALGYKSGSVKQFIDSGSLNRVIDVNDDGTYTEAPITHDELRSVIPEDLLIRIGKNKFFKLTIDE